MTGRADDAGGPRAERVAAFRAGLSAESRAAALLVAKGYRIVARRWRSPVGEVDIVARRGRALIFVEVKARSRLDAAAESLLPRQQRRIVAAASAWLAEHPDDVQCNIRFDAVLVAPGRMPRHMPAAFESE
jgi:putative endonuclease